MPPYSIDLFQMLKSSLASIIFLIQMGLKAVATSRVAAPCRGYRPFFTDQEHTGSWSGRSEPTGGRKSFALDYGRDDNLNGMEKVLA